MRKAALNWKNVSEEERYSNSRAKRRSDEESNARTVRKKERRKRKL